MNFFINELSEKCHERCCARPNHLWGHPKCSLGGPGPHLSGPILLRCRPGRGKPLFWPLGAGIPQQAKTKVAKKAPNLNQRRGWLGGYPRGRENRGGHGLSRLWPWGTHLHTTKTKKFINVTHKEKPQWPSCCANVVLLPCLVPLLPCH